MEKPSYGAISVERRGVTDWITLNRAERLNALDHAMRAPAAQQKKGDNTYTFVVARASLEGRPTPEQIERGEHYVGPEIPGIRRIK